MIAQVIGLVVIAGLTQSPAPARPASVPPSAPGVTLGEPAAVPAPYRKLFDQEQARAAVRKQAAIEDLRATIVQPRVKPPKVVCGMKVFEVDDSADPRMVRRPDPGTPVPAIRTFGPATCAE